MFLAGFALGMVVLSMLSYIVYYLSELGKRRMNQILIPLLRNSGGLYPSQIAKESRLSRDRVQSWLRHLVKKRMVDWQEVSYPGKRPMCFYKLNDRGVAFLVNEFGVRILRSWKI